MPGNVVRIPLRNLVEWRIYHEGGFMPSASLVSGILTAIDELQAGIGSHEQQELLLRYDLVDLLDY